MAKKAYIGVNNVARRIKKMYVGVNGVARRIKKAYIGIGGVARQFFGLEGIYCYGTATNLSVARYCLAATTVGSYALFGGGSYTNISHATVDVYNSSLTRSTATNNLSVGRFDLVATTLGNYALFGGGERRSSDCDSGVYATVDVYNSSLTKSAVTNLSVARSNLAATTVGNYALFGGGNDYATVDAYNSSLTRSAVTDLSVGRYGLAATTLGNYALFGGGSLDGRDIVDVYTVA